MDGFAIIQTSRKDSDQPWNSEQSGSSEEGAFTLSGIPGAPAAAAGAAAAAGTEGLPSPITRRVAVAVASRTGASPAKETYGRGLADDRARRTKARKLRSSRRVRRRCMLRIVIARHRELILSREVQSSTTG